MIYTIGYQRLPLERLREIAEKLDAILIYCRFKPVSRKPGFGRRQLETLLGTKYEWRGNELGGRGTRLSPVPVGHSRDQAIPGWPQHAPFRSCRLTRGGQVPRSRPVHVAGQGYAIAPSPSDGRPDCLTDHAEWSPSHAVSPLFSAAPWV
jgi:hypothetical protein